MIELFTLNEHSGQVSVNMELRSLTVFREWIATERNRKKPRITAEAAYLYFFCDYRSPYRTYLDLEERHKAVLDGVGLKDGWKPSRQFEAVREFYEKHQASEDILLVRETREAAMSGRRLISSIREHLEDAISDYRSPEAATSDNGEIDYDKTAEQRQRLLKTAMTQLRELMGWVKDLPDVVKNLQQLEEDLLRKQNRETNIRGGGSVGMFEL